MPKLNKRGEITIPKNIRSALNTFPGMKFEADIQDGKILLIPYNYKCADCGADIAEGTKSFRCEKCYAKNCVVVY